MRLSMYYSALYALVCGLLLLVPASVHAQISCEEGVELTATASTLTVPAAGGTVTFDLTIVNNSSQACFTECYIIGKKRRSGRILLSEQFGASGNLQPGGSITDSYELTFPDYAPNIEYKVRLLAGIVDDEVVYDAQAFIITKGGALVAQPAETADATLSTYALSAPSPNPAADRTHVTLEVAVDQPVRVAVYDALGRQVALLHDGPLASGTPHQLTFDGAGLPAGVYTVRAAGKAFSDARVLTLTR